jgi:hypothetical protein
MSAARRFTVRAALAAIGAGALPPGCASADMTGVMSGVSTEAYLDANPGVRAELEAIRQPSQDFRTRGNLPQRALILADNL